MEMMVVRPALMTMDGSWVMVQSQILYENQIIGKDANTAKRIDQIDKGVSNRWNSSNSKNDRTIEIRPEQPAGGRSHISGCCWWPVPVSK